MRFSRLLVLLSFALLASCDGGISGTGDGRPVIIANNSINTDTLADVDGNGSESDGFPASSSDSDGGGGNAPEQDNVDVQMPPAEQHLPLPITLPNSLPVPIPAALSANNGVSDDSIINRISPLANALVTQTSRLSQSLEVLINADSDPLTPEDTSTLLEEIVTLCSDFNSCDPAFNSSQDSLRINRFQRFSNPNYNWIFEFNFDIDSSARMRWNDSQTLIETTIDSTALSINILYVDMDGATRTTLRVIDKINAAALTMILTPREDGTFIEANWQTDGIPQQQLYIRGLTSNALTTLFSRHPVDQGRQPLSREIISGDGRSLSLQVCDSGSADCAIETENGNFIEQLADPTPDSQQRFDQFINDFSGFDNTLANDLTASNIPQNVDNFLVASASNADELTAFNSFCNAQRFDQQFRTFCWTLDAITSSVNVYSELTEGGQFVWRLLD